MKSYNATIFMGVITLIMAAGITLNDIIVGSSNNKDINKEIILFACIIVGIAVIAIIQVFVKNK